MRLIFFHVFLHSTATQTAGPSPRLTHTFPSPLILTPPTFISHFFQHYLIEKFLPTPDSVRLGLSVLFTVSFLRSFSTLLCHICNPEPSVACFGWGCSVHHAVEAKCIICPHHPSYIPRFSQNPQMIVPGTNKCVSIVG